TVPEINAYFASDLMVSKVRDLIGELNGLQDTIKAGDLQAQLNTLREDAIRQLKDRTDLFVEGSNIIRLGRHPFSVNTQALDVTIVPRDGEMCLHLAGTNFFANIDDQAFLATRPVWDQQLPSENAEVYRAEFLAYQMLQHQPVRPDPQGKLTEIVAEVQTFMATRYQEGYLKGVHDQDAARILQALLDIEGQMGLLRYAPEVRACASLFWHGLVPEKIRTHLQYRIKGAGMIRELFPDTEASQALIEDLTTLIEQDEVLGSLFGAGLAAEAAAYLFDELSTNDSFVISGEAADAYQQFEQHLKKRRFSERFETSLARLAEAPEARYELIRDWVRAFSQQEGGNLRAPGLVEEVAALLFGNQYDIKRVQRLSLVRDIPGMAGEHAVLSEGIYHLDYHAFLRKLRRFEAEVVPAFARYQQRKKELIQQARERLRLEEFRPRVLTSFVRNQLIDRLYLPIIGDNLAKQIGTAGEQTRTDRQGLLLLISPPGYGKTTLMEYIANRLGLIFMKINGPAIGHQVTSLDPAEAPNAGAREEVEKLNLALEMGDNVMLYLDDIQHCNPEFLQKFISLTDAQRRIEGVYQGKTRTYDLRGKKVAVVMAGNPYTESGEKFRLPDMLANRADTYNLGDILGDNDEAFKLSYLENALTSNPVLHPLSTRSQKDILNVIKLAETDQAEGLEWESNLSTEEIADYVSVMKKLLVIRDVILTVNQQYIASAAQADVYRTEPPFLLQGSYRNMNRLTEKVAPIMNDRELQTLILSHYETESQTLTSGAEANLLKFKQLTGWATPEDERRWEQIREMFLQQKNLSADRLTQLVAEMSAFSQGLQGIREVLEKGIKP
ncbi:MAG: AAA family ATPase, partial [Bacteroidetes bacterium]